MNRQEEINRAQQQQNQGVVYLNGQAYIPVSANQPVYAQKPRLPGVFQEMTYINLCRGRMDRNGDGMIGDNELIGQGVTFSQRECFEVIARYAGMRDFSVMNFAIKNEKFDWFPFCWTKQTGPIAIPFGNHNVRIITVNPGDLEPGSYNVIRIDDLGVPKIQNFQITP